VVLIRIAAKAARVWPGDLFRRSAAWCLWKDSISKQTNHL